MLQIIVMTAKSFPSLANYLKLQIVHLNFRSSVWTAWCCSRVYLWPKDLLQMRQVKRGWPWIFWCFLNVATESVRKSQPCDRHPNCGLSKDNSKSSSKERRIIIQISFRKPVRVAGKVRDCLLQLRIGVLAAWALVGRPGDVLFLN